MSDLNFATGTIWTGDCLDIMRGMNSETFDLIYLDPPFNSNANYAAPVGSEAAGAAFKDTWTLSDVDTEWINLIEDRYPAVHRVLLAAPTDSIKSYLAYMGTRLLEMPRLLKLTGSVYLHCNQDMSHYLKVLMDAIWGRDNFINEIVWNYGTPSGGRAGGRKPVKTHDVLIVFARDYGKHLYNRQYTPYSERYVNDWFRHVDESGRRYRTRSRKGEIKRQYLDESPGVPLSTVWSDFMQLSSRRGWFPSSKAKSEETGYPTQKPIALLDRIIRASSNEGDIVLDPFCGCATTLVAADRLGREWAGIDLSAKAAELVVQRIEADQGLWRNITHRTDVPQRSDLGVLPRYNSRENREALYGQQGGFCAGCREHFQPRHFEVDHIIARKKGGTDHIANLQLLCGNCNRVKGDRGMEYLRAKLQLSPSSQKGN